MGLKWWNGPLFTFGSEAEGSQPVRVLILLSFNLAPSPVSAPLIWNLQKRCRFPLINRRPSPRRPLSSDPGTDIRCVGVKFGLAVVVAFDFGGVGRGSDGGPSTDRSPSGDPGALAPGGWPPPATCWSPPVGGVLGRAVFCRDGIHAGGRADRRRAPVTPRWMQSILSHVYENRAPISPSRLFRSVTLSETLRRPTPSVACAVLLLLFTRASVSVVSVNV